MVPLHKVRPGMSATLDSVVVLPIFNLPAVMSLTQESASQLKPSMLLCSNRLPNPRSGMFDTFELPVRF